MTKQTNLRLDEELLKEFEDLAEQENLDRSSLMKKVLSSFMGRFPALPGAANQALCS